MTMVIGEALALVLTLGTVAALWLAWHRPIVAMGVLVAGMAFHSFLLMALLGLDTPRALVRVFQAWKEILLAFLFLVAVLTLWRNRSAGLLANMTPTDWIMVAFAMLTVVYLIVPSSVLGSNANLTQRVLGFRVVALIPLLYFLGRVFARGREADLRPAIWICMGAAGVVTVVGLVELWLLPTRVWLNWGVNLYTSFLGYTYNGPGGLPENFFLTLANGTLVRRMVSTYISPLPLAYTALLLMPLGVALVERQPERARSRWFALGLLGLMLVGLMFSVTRLAILVSIPEAALLALLLRRRWLVGMTALVGLAAAFMLLVYPSIGPVVNRSLLEVGGRATGQVGITTNDVSATEHFDQIVIDLRLDLQHPLGLGVGASQGRFGKLVGSGESAVLGVFGDMGLVGGFLYVALYLAALWNGFRAFLSSSPGTLRLALPLTALVGGLALLPITMTSDVWGDLSVTFLFWWAAGASATLAMRPLEVRETRRPADTASTTVRAT